MKTPGSFKCPVCKAPAGFPCRSTRGFYLPRPHNRRIHLARPDAPRSTYVGVTGEVAQAKE
jgi:hypothetical protein